MCAWLIRRATRSGRSRQRIPPAPILVAAPTMASPGASNQNPSDIGLLALLAEDLFTHDGSLLEPGFWAVALHRVGNARLDIRSRLVRAPFSLAYEVLRTALDWGFGIDLGHTVTLGRRVRLWHHGGMVLHARAIGDDVQIRQNTNFGPIDRTAVEAKPIIGDRVDVGVGACVLGAVVVGHDSVIGANSVVVGDVPPFTTVFGVPARPAVVRSPAEPPPSTPRALRSVKPHD